MSLTNGRSVSDHFTNISNLNSASDFEPAVSDNDLALFTNSQFFDWDVAEPVDQKFNALSAQPSDAGLDNAFTFQGMPLVSGDEFAVSQQHPQPQEQSWIPDSETTGSVDSPPGQPSQSSRRRTDPSRQSHGSESVDALQVSAEEDKRRRNTAASARFRVKKKQREQAMEQTAKEMTDRVQRLEAKVTELEKENRLLKGLLTEKSSSRPDAEGSRKRLKHEETSS